jgi:hypothetical protein
MLDDSGEGYQHRPERAKPDDRKRHGAQRVTEGNEAALNEECRGQSTQ